MSINHQLSTLRAAIAEYAQSISAELAVAADRGDFMNRIQNNPTGMTIVLMFTGERLDEEAVNALVVWRNFSVILARPHGWTLQRADNLTEDRPEGPPFYEVLEETRNLLINIEFGGDSLYDPLYRSAALLDTGEAPMDAWELVFECGARLTE